MSSLLPHLGGGPDVTVGVQAVGDGIVRVGSAMGVTQMVLMGGGLVATQAIWRGSHTSGSIYCPGPSYSSNTATAQLLIHAPLSPEGASPLVQQQIWL